MAAVVDLAKGVKV